MHGFTFKGSTVCLGVDIWGSYSEVSAYLMKLWDQLGSH